MTPQSHPELAPLFSAAFEAAATGIVITDAAGIIRWANPAFCLMTGYEAADVIGQHTRLLKSGCQTTEFYRSLWETITAGRVWRGQLVNRRKDGSEYPEAMTITPVSGSDDAITHYIAIKEDVSERVAADRALRESEEINRVTFEQAAVGIAHVAPDGRFLRVNQEFCRVTGQPGDSLLAMTFQQITHPDDLPVDLAHVRRMLSGDLSSYTLEKRYIRPDGSAVPATLSVSLVRDGNGQPRFFISTIRDISAERERDLKLQRSQRLESLGTLASSIAHDLNNALSPIVMSLEMLNEACPDQGDLLGTVHGAASRAAGMARRLLTFARGSDGHKVPVDLTPVVREMQTLIRSTFPGTIQLEMHLDDVVHLVVGDATQLHQVLLNLCVNARDAMPEGGRLCVAVETRTVDALFAAAAPDAVPGHYHVVSVSDTGVGIPASVLDHIFEPFFTTKAADHGTGLGLATVLNIVRSHRGFVQVSSEVGRGTTFSVFLPVEANLGLGEHEDSAAATFLGHGELVLLVDDDAPVREIGQTVLRHLHLTPVVAADGIDGLMRAIDNRDRIRAVLVDLFMPHLDGLGFIKALRRVLPSVPVAAVSGRFEEAARAELRALGVTVHLEKPFTELELAGALQALLPPQQ